jgi:hypothetical protein
MSTPKKLSEQEIYYETVMKTQQRQLTEANKKINELKLEIEGLKTETRHLRSLPASDILVANKKGPQLSNEEIICLQEISKLKDVSDERPLDFDETKRFDILVKTLKSLKSKEETANHVESISTSDLLQALQQAAK